MIREVTGMRIGVVTFPGLARRPRRRPRRPHRRRRGRSRSGTATPTCTAVDAVVLPGGFSYGDYLRCGAIARFAPVMGAARRRRERRPAGARHLQRLPGAVRVAPAARRAHAQRPPALRLPRPEAAHRERPTRRGRRTYEVGQEIVVPLKNGEGGYVADEATLDVLEGEGRVVARYLELNPNGCRRDIAGISNAARQRRRAHAAPRARRRGPHRPDDRRPRASSPRS